MKNSLDTLNIKEQFILRQILSKGCFNSLLRYDYDFLKSYSKTFLDDSNFNTYDQIWSKIQVVVRGLLKKNVIEFETGFLKAEVSPSGRQMKTRTYKFKQYWKTNNSYELKQFHSKFSNKRERTSRKK